MKSRQEKKLLHFALLAVYLGCLGCAGDLLPSITFLHPPNPRNPPNPPPSLPPSRHHLPLIKVFVVTLRSGV